MKLSTPAEASPSEGRVVGRHFRMIRRLGKVPLGTLWRALDLRTERPVAIVTVEKTLPFDLAALEPLAGLRHPALIEGVCAFVEDKTLHLCREWVDTVSSLVWARQQKTSEGLLAPLRPIAKALQYLHAAGLIYRELRPANIHFIDGVARLMDLMTTWADAQIRPWRLPYAAPELQEGIITPKADIYALGITLFELATGQVPFSGNDRQVMEAHRLHPVVIPPEIPGSCARLLRGCLEKDPNRRWSAAEVGGFLDQLGQAEAGEWQLFPGDDLARAFHQAPDGATIRLSAGEWISSEPILRTGISLKIEGAGAGESRLAFTNSGSFLTFRDCPQVSVAKVTIEQRGEGETRLLKIEGGHFSIRSSAFVGARGRVGNPGVGVWIATGATGEIKQCQFRENQVGLAIESRESIQISANEFRQQRGPGLICAGAATGWITGNQFQGNGDGIGVAGTATPTIEGNQCVGNRGSGIHLAGKAGGELRNNQCHENGAAGILVGSQAAPRLQGNVCRGNQGSGLAYREQAAGTAAANELRENHGHGIAVTDQAAPALELNQCCANRDRGMCFESSAGGSASRTECSGNQGGGVLLQGEATSLLEDNRCVRNGGDGIAIVDRATPGLLRNLCDRNEAHGIFYGGQGGGEADENQCSGNWLDGIAITQEAHPALTGNVSSRNHGVGLVYRDRASGRAYANYVSDNDGGGLLVEPSAQPLLENNTVENDDPVP